MSGLEKQLRLDNPIILDDYLNLIADVYSRVKGFLNMYDTIRREITMKTLNQFVMDDRYLELLLGGLRDNLDKPFPEDAMVNFTADILGVKVTESTAREIVARVRNGETLETACRDLRPEILEEPDHIKLLRLLAKELHEALEKTGKTLSELHAYRFEKAESIAKALADTLTWARKLLPLYNPTSFFIQSLYSIPHYYAQQAYPGLPRLERLLEEKLATRVETIYEPDIANQRIREQTKIIGISKDSAALSILKAVYITYKLFQVQKLEKHFSVEDEFKKYAEVYKDKITELMRAKKKSKELLKLRCTSVYSLEEQRQIDLISPYGVFAAPYERYDEVETRYTFKAWRTTCGISLGSNVALESVTGNYSPYDSYVDRYRVNISWIEFVNIMAPLMFLGLAYIRPREGKDKPWLSELSLEHPCLKYSIAIVPVWR